MISYPPLALLPHPHLPLLSLGPFMLVRAVAPSPKRPAVAADGRPSPPWREEARQLERGPVGVLHRLRLDPEARCS